MGDSVGDIDNYTHVTFYYEYGGVLTVNKTIHLRVYPNETAQRIVYTIRE